MEERVVHIFTAAFGEGHNSAAKGLRVAFERTGLPGMRAEISDPFAMAYPRLNAFLSRAYIEGINRAPHTWSRFYTGLDRSDRVSSPIGRFTKLRRQVRTLVDGDKTAAVLLVYPACGYVLGRIFSETPCPFPRITVITDSITINRVWLRYPSDAYVVANPESAEAVARAGVDPSRIFDFGFPVHPDFADQSTRVLEAKDRGANRPANILYMINSGKHLAPRIVESLRQGDDREIVVTVGRDTALREKIEQVAKGPGAAVQVHGWTDQMPKLMAQADILIGKAGGATVQEALAAKCPMIVSQVVPGQEEGNARLIESIGCGVVATGPEEVPALVNGALATGRARLREWQAAVAQASRPDAAMTIARWVCGLVTPEKKSV